MCFLGFDFKSGIVVESSNMASGGDLSIFQDGWRGCNRQGGCLVGEQVKQIRVTERDVAERDCQFVWQDRAFIENTVADADGADGGDDVETYPPAGAAAAAEQRRDLRAAMRLCREVRRMAQQLPCAAGRRAVQAGAAGHGAVGPAERPLYNDAISRLEDVGLWNGSDIGVGCVFR